MIICVPALLGSALFLAAHLVGSGSGGGSASASASGGVSSSTTTLQNDGAASGQKSTKQIRQKAAGAVAGAVAKSTVVEKPRKERVIDTVSTTSGGIEYHIVFSTGCSLYQDWQSYVFFFQAMMAKQPGTVTRIVSGCEPEDEQTMAEQFANEIHPMAPGRFQIHFTPDYSKTPSGKTFVYWSTYMIT